MALLMACAAVLFVGPAAAQAGAAPVGVNPLDVLRDAAQMLPGASEPLSPAARGGVTPAPADSRGLSVSLNILLLLTVISLVPSIMLMTTCFVRIIIVLGLLRQAIGAQSLPPGQVITGLALFMTALVMQPTIERVWNEAVVPYREGQIRDYETLWARGTQPLRDFMFDQIEATDNWSSLYMVLEYRGVDVSDPSRITRAQVPTTALVPAYMLSELKTAFLMGFRVYLPFLVIDMVIASLLISMSMMMLPPVLISLPFKLLLFVLVDGWTLVVGSLLESFVVSPASDPASAALTLCLVPLMLRRHGASATDGLLPDTARVPARPHAPRARRPEHVQHRRG
jgi:flagellar biosynthetic protein FliP